MLDRRGYFRWLLRGCDNVIQRLGWLWQALETLGSVFPTEPTEPQRINLLTVCTQQPWCHGNFKNGGEGQGVSVCVNVRERKNVHLCVCVFDFRSLGSGCSEAESLELSADLVPKVTIRSVYHRGAVCVCVCVCVRACVRATDSACSRSVYICEHSNCHIYTHVNNTYSHSPADPLPETSAAEQVVGVINTCLLLHTRYVRL